MNGYFVYVINAAGVAMLRAETPEAADRLRGRMAQVKARMQEMELAEMAEHGESEAPQPPPSS